jgi:ribosome hibernation promoting factor
MDIITTARHFDMTDEVRNHAQKRMEKLQRYLSETDDVHLILTMEKYRKIAEFTIHVRGNEIVSRGVSDEMIVAIDRAIDRIERQIKRLKSRQRNRKEQRRGTLRHEILETLPPATPEPMEEESMDFDLEEIDFAPVVIRSDEFQSDPMSVEDAISLMKERDQDYLLFKDAKTDQVTLVHHRADGNYTLVEAT